MRVLIVGNKGFIGSHCHRFAKNMGWDTWGCDIVRIQSQNYIQLDSLNPDYAGIFRSKSFDLCINASGSASVAVSYSNPELDYKLNVTNVELLLSAILKYSPDCRFINFSSAAVYGNPLSLPISEQDPVSPLSPYGNNKLASEEILKHYSKKHGIATCSLRIFSAYGPGLRKQLFWDIYQKMRRNKHIKLFGSGTESRDFIYIDDIILAIKLVIDHTEFSGEAINIASGQEVTINEAAFNFAKIVDENMEVVFTGNEKKGDPKNWCADINVLLRMGFAPQNTMISGLTNYYKWLKEDA